MRVLDIAQKDLVQVVRDKKSLLFLVLMPVVFTLFFGFAFAREGVDPRLPVGWVDRDDGRPLGAQLRDLIEATGTVRVVPLDGDEAERADERVLVEKLAAVVTVPDGFSARAFGEKPLPLSVVVPNTTAGQTASTALKAATKRLLAAAEAARLSVEAVMARVPAASRADEQTLFDASLSEAAAAWQSPPLAVTLEAGVGGAMSSKTPVGFLQSSPGMMVQFAVFSIVSSAMVVVLERKSGAMRRLLTAPIGRGQLIVGHLLAMFVVVFLQEVVLILLGQFALGVDYFSQPLGTLVMMVALGLCAASLGLLIGTLAKGEEQVVMYGMIAMMLIAALGGAWFPLEATGPGFSAIGHATPGAWAMEGFQNIVVRGLGFGTVLLPAGVLLAYAAAFLGLAVWHFRFE